MNNTKIPNRSEVEPRNTWDLSTLFASDDAWSAALEVLEQLGGKIPAFKGSLGKSAESLADFLDFYRDLGILEERLGTYAQLRTTEDEGDGKARTMLGKFMMADTGIQAALSWATPEIQAVPDADMGVYLSHGRLRDYRIYLERLLRLKSHILSEKEERILALHAEGDNLAQEAFSVLTNVDMSFGNIDTAQGPLPLTKSTWAVFMENPNRAVRKKAYESFYEHFAALKTSLGALYGGSVKKDVINARIRGYSSARAAALFPDNVPETVYDNLVSTIGANLEPLHRYYGLRKKVLRLDTLRHYDAYVPLVGDISRKTSWNEAVGLVSLALAPLGDEYVNTLRAGLLDRWADRYENQGKRAGAFSAGTFTGDPYILMNYQEDSIGDVFTLAHEGGHSMHSWYSVRANPFIHYSYSIFEAEVASTFNEELLFRQMMKTAGSDEDLKTWLINRRADTILSTLYRQTMFAEFEQRSHELEEGGTPLTADLLRSEYRKLLEKYFGPGMVFEKNSDLEGLRIPHFYNAFYVYKYSTGISASLALAERVLSGGKAEREDYYRFLMSGGSRFPIDSLKLAGVDMSSPAPVEAACKIFGRLVDELEKRLD
ncbi:MAG: oligoendopeptidase F [Treponema sp.]|jgi:oligoendopeptidase F|nr:oligoendopeptidase F [Treponema sp.]